MKDRSTFSPIFWDEFPESDILVCVHLDRDTYDFGHLIARAIEINGRLYRCTDVERRYASGPPFRAGERIGLRVVPLD